MTNDASMAIADAYVVHGRWLRRLARELVGDAVADDLVQQTWLTALRHPPALDRPLRPWLARVLRNTERMGRRTRVRRERREARAVPEPAAPDVEQLIGELQQYRVLTEILEQLREPFRGTVLRRYAQEQSAAQIAELDGVREATVRWRIKRGLDMVRTELDRRHGGCRRSWAAVLCPAMVDSAPPSLVSAGIVMTKTKVVAGIAALSVATIVGGAALVSNLGALTPGGDGRGSDVGGRDRLGVSLDAARRGEDGPVPEPAQDVGPGRRRGAASSRAAHDTPAMGGLVAQVARRSSPALDERLEGPRATSAPDDPPDGKLPFPGAAPVESSPWLAGRFGETARAAGVPAENIHNLGERMRPFGITPDDSLEEAAELTIEGQESDEQPPDSIPPYSDEQRAAWLSMERADALVSLASDCRQQVAEANAAGADYVYTDEDYVRIAENLLSSWECEAAGLPLTCASEQGRAAPEEPL